MNELSTDKNNPAAFYSNSFNLSYNNRIFQSLTGKLPLANNSSNWNGWGVFMINSFDYKLGNGFSAKASVYQGKIGSMPVTTQVKIGVRKTFDWNKTNHLQPL